MVWLRADGVTPSRVAAARKLSWSATATNAVRSARSPRRIDEISSAQHVILIGFSFVHFVNDMAHWDRGKRNRPGMWASTSGKYRWLRAPATDCALGKPGGFAISRDGSLGEFFGHQFFLGQFADQRLGQLIAELDLARALDRRDVSGEEFVQLLLGDGMALAQGDESFRHLALIGVGHTDHHRLGYGRMLVEGFLDHAGIDIVAAGDDQILDAVDQEDIAVLIDIADIAGPERSVDEDIGGLVGTAPIALHHLRPAHADLALLAPGQDLGGIFRIADFDDGAGQRHTDRAISHRAHAIEVTTGEASERP